MARCQKHLRVAAPMTCAICLENERKAFAEDSAKLAAFLIQEIPHEPSRSEGAVDCAIRVMRIYRLAMKSAMLNLSIPHPGSVAPVAFAHEKLRLAYTGEWEYDEDEEGDTNGSEDSQG